jgi:hypothetical protein
MFATRALIFSAFSRIFCTHPANVISYKYLSQHAAKRALAWKSRLKKKSGGLALLVLCEFAAEGENTRRSR